MKPKKEKLPIAEQTFNWIRNYPFIIYALKKDLINFSSLARRIQDDIGVKNFDAILVAIRRYQNQIKWIEDDKKIMNVLKNSKLEIKTGVNVYVIEKEDIELLKNLKYYHMVHGGDKIELITNHNLDLETTWRNVAEIRIRSPDIDLVPGVIAYITSTFAERGINIIKMYSFHGDVGYFVFDKNDLPKVIETLERIGIS